MSVAARFRAFILMIVFFFGASCVHGVRADAGDGPPAFLQPSAAKWGTAPLETFRCLGCLGISSGEMECSNSPPPFGPYPNSGSPLEKHFVRAGMETLGFLAVSSAYYWSDGATEDYDFSGAGAGLSARFDGRAYRFDDNKWGTNFRHSVAGAGYYLLGRSNNLSLLESFGLSTGAAFTWEAFVELREVASVNDILFTPFAGLPMGEVVYQFGDFFLHSCPNIPNSVFGLAFGAPELFHRNRDHSQPKVPEKGGRFGFPRDVWHDFRFYSGVGWDWVDGGGHDRSIWEVGVDLRLINDSLYGMAGEECILYTDGFFTELLLDFAMDEDHIIDWNAMARIAFWGLYQQDLLEEEGSHRLNGFSSFFGLASAFEYLGHVFSGTSRVERFAVCDLLGPSWIADYYHCGMHLRTMVDAYPTFSLVMPFSAKVWKQEWLDSHPGDPSTKSVFVNEDYYYAMGLTAGIRLEAAYERAELDSQVRYYLFDSLEGLDRHQDTLRDDFNLQDGLLVFKTGLAYTLPLEGLKTFVEAQRLLRWSSIDIARFDKDETRFSVGLRYDL